MKIGVVSRSFPELTNLETASFMQANGFTSTELCLSATDSKYWTYNGRSDLTDMTDERFLSIVNVYREHGIEVPALGVFTNLIHPDDTERNANLAYFVRHIELAGIANIPFVSTECGFDPEHRGVRTTCYESAINIFKDSMSYLCDVAAEHNVSICLETCVIDIVPSAKRARDIINQVGKPNFKVLLDPANLIANSSEEDMFSYLAPHIGYFHGKDRRVNDCYGKVVGDGDIDWKLFLKLYHKYCEGAPFILEYVNQGNVCEIRDRVLAFDS